MVSFCYFTYVVVSVSRSLREAVHEWINVIIKSILASGRFGHVIDCILCLTYVVMLTLKAYPR